MSEKDDFQCWERKVRDEMVYLNLWIWLYRIICKKDFFFYWRELERVREREEYTKAQTDGWCIEIGSHNTRRRYREKEWTNKIKQNYTYIGLRIPWIQPTITNQLTNQLKQKNKNKNRNQKLSWSNP